MSTTTDNRPRVLHGNILSFAGDRVNLKSVYAKKYRKQVRQTRDHIERYINENPDTGMVKTLLSGSLAKSTALSTIDDVDVALYVRADSAPSEHGELLEWLAESLRTTFPQKAASEIYVDGPCVVISYLTTGLNVEVAPIFYEGDPQWRGFLWDRFTSRKTLTSVPMHLEFLKKRKNSQPDHFVQVVRLLKWWARAKSSSVAGFKLRSFLIELILAHLSDNGQDMSDYPSALEEFFVYVTNSGLQSRISFSDYYSQNQLPIQSQGAIEIFDPVNAENNVASDYSEYDRQKIVEVAEEAVDSITYARRAVHKGEAVECWQEILGTSFRP